MKKKVIIFYHRGQIERGTGKGSYVWRDGYSETTPEGRVLYPWNTYRECQAGAKARGCVAKFVRKD